MGWPCLGIASINLASVLCIYVLNYYIQGPVLGQMQLLKKRKLNADQIDYVPTALKIAYFGKSYHGLQMQGFIPTDNTLLPMMEPATIESTLVKALLELNFVHPLKWKDNFSKCGRTDKGVSCFSNVIVLNIRNIPNPINAINSRLPNDVRVVGFAKVSAKFNARFDCQSRTYRYYFVRSSDICINKMRKAATYLIGEHDFRNFCKIDDNLTTFVRNIYSITFSHFSNFNSEEIWVAEIKGSAFLWHQIRYTMAILFLVGRGLEHEDISWLLNPLEVKPNFDMASELGLVLWDTEFDINWIHDECITINSCALAETTVPDAVHFKDNFRGRITLHDIVQCSKHQLLIELALKEAFIEKYSLFNDRASWGITGGLSGQSGHLTTINKTRIKQLPSVKYKTLRDRQKR
eukprot:NODE_445_length_8540_cov_0.746239.p2 type:complete len:406 gc:universal NODE_445_length_8540_cov_0.746239:7746-6529(-)